MNKPPHISFDINVCQPGDSAQQDLISLFRVEALVIEEYLPALLASHYYYPMLWWDVVSNREGYNNSNSPEAP